MNISYFDWEVAPNWWYVAFLEKDIYHEWENYEGKIIYRRGDGTEPDIKRINGSWKTIEDPNFICDDQKAIDLLKKYITTKGRILCGYNSFRYDAQLNEHIIRGYYTNDLIYRLSKQIINQNENQYNSWEYSTRNLDPFKVWGYDNQNKRVSLKDLMFIMRSPNMSTLPFDPNANLDLKTISESRKYCKFIDIPSTKKFAQMSKEKFNFRLTQSKRLRVNLLNASDNKIGTEEFLIELAKEYNTSVKKLRHRLKGGTPRENGVRFSECVLPYYKFHHPEFKKVFDWFMRQDLDKDVRMKLNNGDARTDITVLVKGMKVKFAHGGVHGVVPTGWYKSYKDYIIWSGDVSSQYPNIGIVNGFHPEHIDPKIFRKVYKAKYLQRKKYPKGTTLNLGLKLLLNCVYGNSNFPFSIMYDPKYYVQIILNGQLGIAYLMDLIIKHVPECIPLMMNTDGIEVAVRKKHYKQLMKVCNYWQRKTMLDLEHDRYKHMFISNVNNYMAEYENGKVKRKGRIYCTYEDIIGSGEMHKDTSNRVISNAITEFVINDIMPSQTVRNCNNIYDFLAKNKVSASGNKAGHLFYTMPDLKHPPMMNNGTITTVGGHRVQKEKQKLIRVYVTKYRQGKTVIKQFKRNLNMQVMNQGLPVCQLNKMPTTQASITAHLNKINRTFYVDEVWKIIEPVLENIVYLGK